MDAADGHSTWGSAMSLKDKAAKIELGDLDAPTAPLGSPAAVPVVPLGRGRSGVAAITHSIGMHHRVQDLEAQVAKYEESRMVVMLDPKLIQQSKWKNRHELTFSTQKYADLKAEMEASGGNVQAIKVRTVGKGDDGQDKYEIVYGRRRLRACLELGFPVAAVIEDMDDIQLFKEMERENRNREDLSPWEQGVMYKDALSGGLFTSQRRMADALNIPQSLLSMAMKLASLPQEVVAAFPTPLDLQYRWGAELAEALEKDTARMMTVAAEIAAMEAKPPAKSVLARLLSAEAEKPRPIKREIKIGDKVVGTWVRDLRGALTIKVRAGVLSAAKEKKLVDFLDTLMN